jgi:hypothetical protein
MSNPSLLERVEAATGADREIDAALHVALVKPEQYPDDLRYFRLPCASMDHMEMCTPGTYWLKQRSGASLHTSPAYTSSLDAALSLVERVLPGWHVDLRIYADSAYNREKYPNGLATATLYRYVDHVREHHCSDWLQDKPFGPRVPAPIAVLIALLKATEEKPQP